jgi:hypothetical protein
MSIVIPEHNMAKITNVLKRMDGLSERCLEGLNLPLAITKGEVYVADLIAGSPVRPIVNGDTAALVRLVGVALHSGEAEEDVLFASLDCVLNGNATTISLLDAATQYQVGLLISDRGITTRLAISEYVY